MSKKLIAVASAAALALAGLVAVPTVATADVGAFNVVADGAVTNHVARDGSTASKSIQVNVPTADVLRFEGSTITVGRTTSASAIQLTVTTPGATDAITVTSTGGVKVLTDTAFAETSPAPTTATGTQSLSDVAANGDAVIYAYTTSTTAGTVTVSAAGSSKTFHISGLSEFVYKLNLAATSTAAISGDVTITGTAVDAFGNNLTTSVPEASWTVTGLGGNFTGDALTDTFTYDATAKTYKMVVTNRSSAGTAALSVTLGDSVKSTKVTAFGDPVLTQFFTVTAADLSAQVTALTAQVAALQAQLEASRPKATSVTKKRFNTLARKWNAANPGSRVALKK
jgi:hypothetical protein